MIRKIVLLLMSVTLGLNPQASPMASTVEQTDIVSIIASALAEGNVATLANYFPVQLSMSLSKKSPSYYSKKQAKQLLAKFFADHKVTKFQVEHSGGKANAKFAIGKLTTSSGIFRVTFFLKGSGTNTVIQNLLIEKKAN